MESGGDGVRVDGGPASAETAERGAEHGCRRSLDGRVRRLSVGVHQRVERAGGHLAAGDRLGEVEALPVCAAQGAHPVGLLRGLDPLGHGPDLE